MRSDLNKPTVLLAEAKGKTAFAGGGCIKFEVLNTADSVCNQFELEINIRPTWGTVLEKDDGTPNFQKLTPIEIDEAAGEHPLTLSKSVSESHIARSVMRDDTVIAQLVTGDLSQVGSTLAREKALTLRQA